VTEPAQRARFLSRSNLVPYRQNSLSLMNRTPFTILIPS